MRKAVWIAGVALLFAGIGVAAPQQDKGPDLTWAYPVPTLNNPKAAPGAYPVTVPGSTKTFTRAEIVNLFGPPDWFPDEHPQMPPVVAHGHMGTDVRACGFCHLPTGQGKPTNANMAGMPAAYLERQIQMIRNGQRKNAGTMVPIAKAVSDDDARAAAEYFASVKPYNWVKVVETDTVPQTYVESTLLRLRKPDGSTEPLGNRIIELMEDEKRSGARDPHSGTIAYVPKGSVEKGKALVLTGAGRTVPCENCHGVALTGLAEVPRLAGLSPMYVTRQIYNYKSGITPGTWAELMNKPVAGLSYDDVVDIAAYLASLPVSGVPGAGSSGGN